MCINNVQHFFKIKLLWVCHVLCRFSSLHGVIFCPNRVGQLGPSSHIGKISYFLLSFYVYISHGIKANGSLSRFLGSSPTPPLSYLVLLPLCLMESDAHEALKILIKHNERH